MTGGGPDDPAPRGNEKGIPEGSGVPFLVWRASEFGKETEMGRIMDVFCQRRAVYGMPDTFFGSDRNGDEPLFAMRGVLFCHFYFFYVHLDNKKYT